MFDNQQFEGLRKNCKGFVVLAAGILAFVILGALVVSISGCERQPSTVPSQKQETYKGEVRKTVLAGGDEYTTRFYDSELKVWCWKTGYNQGGISCIPEWQLEDPYSRVDPNEDPINGGE